MIRVCLRCGKPMADDGLTVTHDECFLDAYMREDVEAPITEEERIEAMMLLGYPNRTTAPTFLRSLNAKGLNDLDSVVRNVVRRPLPLRGSQASKPPRR